jgi:hypothetical protein
LKYWGFLRKDSNYIIGFQIRNQLNNVLFKFYPSKIGKCNRIIQIADPFLFVKNDILYCFYEKYANRGKGYIEVVFSCDLKKWERLKVELNENCHFSFPFIFQENEMQLFMIPETGELNEVALYLCDCFPTNWKKWKSLLIGNYVDSHIFRHNGFYFLFTTKKVRIIEKDNIFDYQLELYYSHNIDGEYLLHPSSPIKTGRKFGRSAGSIFTLDGRLFRTSQDCVNRYGREVNLFEILLLNENQFEEILFQENYIADNFDCEHGGHHLSTVCFKNDKIIAFDVNLKESYLQRFINRLKL